MAEAESESIEGCLIGVITPELIAFGSRYEQACLLVWTRKDSHHSRGSCRYLFVGSRQGMAHRKSFRSRWSLEDRPQQALDR